MKATFRQSMAWLHTWAGLILGWVLYFMFVTGTAGYLDTEIDRWMQPELPVASEAKNDDRRAIQLGLSWLNKQAPDAQRWFISLPQDRNSPYLRALWSDADGETGDDQLDIASGNPLNARDSAGGQLLYQMHWQLHYLPRVFTNWFITIVTMFMFIAIVTGIIIHKNIFKDFFTFRRGKGQRSWLDTHNLMSVLSLPFQLMITYSGLIFVMFIVMPLLIAAFYGGDNGRDRFFEDIFPDSVQIDKAEQPAALVNVNQLIASAESHWGKNNIGYVDINYPGNAHARITFGGKNSQSPLRNSPKLIFDGVSGDLLHEIPARSSAARATRDVFLGLHEGLFAGPFLRVLYLLSGLMGTLMIASGLILWTSKRRQRLTKNRPASAKGVALVERLNIGTIIGLPIAIAAYFWANRLLPLDFINRAEWEAHVMFIVWSVMFLHAAFRPFQKAWIEQSGMAALVFLLLPVLNALTTDRHLAQSLPAGDWVFVGFDLSMLALGLFFAGLMFKLTKQQSAKVDVLASRKPVQV